MYPFCKLPFINQQKTFFNINFTLKNLFKKIAVCFLLAVRLGFEPRDHSRGQWFSRPPLSTTQPPHRKKMLSIQAAITLVTLSQHNNVINCYGIYQTCQRTFLLANLQINIVKSKFFVSFRHVTNKPTGIRCGIRTHVL